MVDYPDCIRRALKSSLNRRHRLSCVYAQLHLTEVEALLHELHLTLELFVHTLGLDIGYDRLGLDPGRQCPVRDDEDAVTHMELGAHVAQGAGGLRVELTEEDTVSVLNFASADGELQGALLCCRILEIIGLHGGLL